MTDLTKEEYQDLWGLLKIIQGLLQPQYYSLQFNIRVQDEPMDSQSVTHVHIRILPRNYGKLDQNNNIYDTLEECVPRADHHPSLQKLDAPKDGARKNWVVEDMKEEESLYQRRLVGNIASTNRDGSSY